MWSSLAHGFLYVYTGMVAGVTGSVLVVTNKIPGTAADWVLPCHALIDRSLATYYATNALTMSNFTVVKITWESNISYSYERSEVTNWGSTNTGMTNTCSTNFFTNQYLYGLQEYSMLSRYNEPDGFEVASTSVPWFRMSNYRVSPLLWGGGGYTVAALSNTIPTVSADFRVADQAGRYVYNWATNNWPYWVTNVTTNTEGVVSTSVVPSIVVTVEGGVTNITTNGPPIWTTSLVETVFLSYNPTNQRPNAITPLMGRSHLQALNTKFNALLPYYYNDTMASAGSFDSYCATAGVYWVSNYYVGAIWFEADKILSTTTQTWNYQPTTWNPAKEISSVVTSITAGTSNNYTYITNIPVEVAGSAEDYDRLEVLAGTSSYPTNGWPSHWISQGGSWGTHTVSGEVAGSAGDYTRVVTNILTSSNGVEGAVDDYNGIKTSITNLIGTPYTSVIIGAASSNAGVAGEIDYYLEEVIGSETNWDRRVAISTNEVAGAPYSFLTTSNHTEDGTSSHFNRTTSRERHDRVYIWAGVSNLLAQYMPPWVVDHTNNSSVGNIDYYDQYLYNHGWSPSYATGWRLYSDSASVAGLNYFWDWTTTNYYLINYDYYRNNTNSDATAWHYQRQYSYYWKYPVSYTYYKNGSWEAPLWIPGSVEEWYGNYTNYYKNQDNFLYKLVVITTNWCIKEPLYRINYQVYPTPPPVYTLSSFMSSHSNMLGATNWMLSPSYLTETQTFLSNWVHVVTNDGIVSSWTNNYFTNTVVSNPAVYSNEFAMSLWAGSLQSRYAAYTSLVWASGGATIESRTRSLSTTNELATTWSSTTISTNLSGGTYNCSIYTYWPGWPGYWNFTFSKTAIRARRLSPAPTDGQIDTYLQFGTTMSGRYDLEGFSYPFGPWVRVTQLTIPAGAMYSDWLGDIDSPPTFPDLVDYTYHHPWGYTIQCKSGSPTFVFKPVFD